jgi:hypothetical protein
MRITIGKLADRVIIMNPMRWSGLEIVDKELR